MDDVFGIQESISRQIVTALKVSLTDSEERGVSDHPVEDPLAYDCYLRACQLMYDWTADAQSRALHLVDQALAISGDVPVLLAMKGQLHWNMVNTSAAPLEVALARASEFSDRALACDPDSRLAIFVRGLVACTSGRIESGLVDLYRAHDLLPGDANVLVELCRFSLSAGLPGSEQLVEKAVGVDPLSPQARLLAAMQYGTYGPVEKAAAPARRSIELVPSASMLHYSAAWWLAVAGQRPEALALYDRLRGETTGALQVIASFLGYALQGDEKRALGPSTNEVARGHTNEWMCRIIAGGYALLGRAEEALAMLRRAVRFGFINYPSLSTDRILLACLEENPDYQELLGQVKPRWEAVVQWEHSR
jgi:tetratricopeptide (TPR) repeat protein